MIIIKIRTQHNQITQNLSLLRDSHFNQHACVHVLARGFHVPSIDTLGQRASTTHHYANVTAVIWSWRLASC